MGDMMPTVYSPDESCEGRPCMEPDPYGGWVSLDDYAALRAERDALQADLKTLLPLAQWGLGFSLANPLPEHRHPTSEQFAAARAILARVATEEGT